MVHDISYRNKDFYDTSIIVRAPSIPESNTVTSRIQRSLYITRLSADELITRLQSAYPHYLFQFHGTVSNDDHYSVPGMVVKAP